MVCLGMNNPPGFGSVELGSGVRVDAGIAAGPMRLGLRVPAWAVLTDPKHLDVAPTVLDLLGVEQPAEMTGRSLLQQ